MLILLTAVSVLATTSIGLPGGSVVTMDYLASDSAHHRLWVPAGNTGNVDVIDTRTGALTAIGGFPTKRPPARGHPNMGPSSAAIGEGVVWIGNRGDNSVCAIDQRKLKKSACIALDTQPDGLLWVKATRELWVTTPRNHTLTIIDPRKRGKDRVSVLPLDGAPEGYAAAEDLFFTNLEDRNKTIAINVRTRKALGEMDAGCDAKGPRGMAVDPSGQLLIVACTDGATSFLLSRGPWAGKELFGARLATGPGVDNIGYWPERRLVYIASGRTAELTIAHVAQDGTMTPVATAPTAEGARVVVVDEHGIAYTADARGARIIVVKPPPSP